MDRMPNLNDAYAVADRDAVRALYEAWAGSYDIAFHAAEGYLLPHAVAMAFVMGGGQGPVLDAGAGTGLVGKALRRHSQAVIDGIDLSQPMLDIAGPKGVYRDLLLHDMADPAPADRRGHYAGLVSAGTFTIGHAGPVELARMADWMAPGSLGIVTVNSVHFNAVDFTPVLARFGDVTQQEVRIYDDRAMGSHRDDTAVLITFRQPDAP